MSILRIIPKAQKQPSGMSLIPCPVQKAAYLLHYLLYLLFIYPTHTTLNAFWPSNLSFASFPSSSLSILGSCILIISSYQTSLFFFNSFSPAYFSTIQSSNFSYAGFFLSSKTTSSLFFIIGFPLSFIHINSYPQPSL